MFSSPAFGRHRLSRGRRRKHVAIGGAVVLLASLSVAVAQATPSSFVELDGNLIKDGTGTYDWANSGALTSPTTAGGTWTRAGSGGLFDGGVFNGNTTPPTAPSRTAAALADTSIADAEFKVDPLSVDVTDCGTGDPTVYTGTGGETNGDIITTDTFGTGSVPNKDDLSNVYAVAHVSGATNEVFFGAERVINNGDSHIDFEFLQSAVTIPDACSGSFTGNRAQGDFLLSVDFTNGGTLGGTVLYKWQCDTVFNAAHDGNVCNPTKKSQAHYQQTATTAVTINVNGGGTIGCGGWVCRQPDGSPTTEILQNELMEGGIDLAQLGFTGCISTFLPHTRSSQSFTATLKDFEIIPFNTCASPTISTQVKKASDNSNVANGGHIPLGTTVYDTATLNGATADAGGTVNYKLYSDSSCTTLSTTPALNQNVTVTNGSVPNSNNVTFNNAGTFYFQATYSGDARNNVPAGGAKSACSSEVVIVDKATPAPHSTPVVQIKDTLSVSGLSSDATGLVHVGLYTSNDCTTGQIGSDATFSTTAAAGGVETSFVGALAGSYYYKISYAGDNNNTGFSSCAESVTVGITSLP